MAVTRMRCGAVATLALTLFGSACHPLRVLDTNALGPVGRLDVSDGPHGSMLATMGQGTSGHSVFELPSGDLLLAGQGEAGFVQRLTPEGRVRWTMQTCWEPNVAVATDEVIYASAATFLDASDRVEEPVPVRRRVCGPRPTPAARTSVVRLDGRGTIQWKRDTDLSEPILRASADHVFVLGASRALGRSELVAFTPRGQVAWTWQGHRWSSTALWSPAHQLLVAGVPVDEHTPVPQACVLTALDEATGGSVWEKTIEFSGSEGSTPMHCSVREILASPVGVILLVSKWTGSTDESVIIGLDPSTGAERWQRSIDVNNFVPSENTPLIPMPGMPLLLETQRYDTPQAGLGGNPIIVALDPETGREAPVAVFRGDLPENHDIDPESRLVVLGFAWGSSPAGSSTVLATGFFRGSVTVSGLHAESESSVETICRNIDPGYGSSSLRDEHGDCKFGSERVRVYGSTLFMARVPVLHPR